MASAFQFGFANPENFSDWAKYAGLDRKTGMMLPTTETPGVAPPETFSDLANQQISAVQNKFSNFGSMLGNVGTQLGQGNVMGAINATRPVAPTAGQPSQTVQVQPMQPVSYDFVGRLKKLENQ